MRPLSIAALVVGLAVGGPARADVMPVPVALAKQPVPKQTDEPGRFRPALLGIIGGAGVVALLASIPPFALAKQEYSQLLGGSEASTCRSCSDRQLVSLRAKYDAAWTLVGVGSALVVADLVLIAIDAVHRRGARKEGPLSLARPGGPMVRF